jgi:hypothetical protein
MAHPSRSRSERAAGLVEEIAVKKFMLWSVVLAVVLAAAPTANASPVRSGAVTDAVEPGRSFDAVRVGVKYDPARGRIEASLKLDRDNAPRVNGENPFGGVFALKVGSGFDRAGRCLADRTGDLTLEGYLAWDYSYGYATMSTSGGPTPIAGGHVVEDFPTYTYVYADPQLVGRDYRCVTAIALGDPQDTVDPFAFNGFKPRRTSAR